MLPVIEAESEKHFTSTFQTNNENVASCILLSCNMQVAQINGLMKLDISFFYEDILFEVDVHG